MGENSPVWFNWVVLIVGVLYLLADLGVWTQWAAISWYTAAFVLLGLKKVAS